MDAPYVLAMAGQTAWTPLSEASLFAHYDLDAVTTIVDTGEGNRLEVASWTDQGPSAKHAVSNDYPGSGLPANNFRPPYLADAGDGQPGIDFADGTYGKGLTAPFSAAAVKFLHDAVSPWTIDFNLSRSAAETVAASFVSTGAWATGQAGILVYAEPHTGYFNLKLFWSDGTTISTVLSTQVSGPERAHYRITCDPAGTPKLRVYRNGMLVDYYSGSLPSLAATGGGYGLCFGKPAGTDPYRDSSDMGRFRTIYTSALTDDAAVAKAVEWAHGKGYV